MVNFPSRSFASSTALSLRRILLLQRMVTSYQCGASQDWLGRLILHTLNPLFWCNMVLLILLIVGSWTGRTLLLRSLPPVLAMMSGLATAEATPTVSATPSMTTTRMRPNTGPSTGNKWASTTYQPWSITSSQRQETKRLLTLVTLKAQPKCTTVWPLTKTTLQTILTCFQVRSNKN